ncbi:GspMb/PilO family protein [Roseobacter sp. MH60115]|uniref:GspMb/PilO family protein n=1 Tax=Roseobacter sp. MH60115 TaxID=2785324 RepID=UPI0018A2A399|nr:GspMb/PilO family protein [Roseobacter sp. MH60115]
MIQAAPRYLAPALTVALIALVWAALATPALEWKRQTLRDATRSEATYLRLISGIRALQQDRAAIQSAPVEGAIWRPTDGRAVTLEMQAALGELAQEAGLAFSAISPAHSDLTLGAETVTLTVELRAPLDAVLSFVSAVETHMPPLIIDAATLKRAQSAGVETDQPVLQAAFRIVAATVQAPDEAPE